MKLVLSLYIVFCLICIYSYLRIKSNRKTNKLKKDLEKFTIVKKCFSDLKNKENKHQREKETYGSL